ncbi:MAG: 5'-methylthioadenosine/adenosylhomocysteine nucleosidase [Lachnospiraceae bacterium]|nr:5'-methylthioadenosine/adenosylhomocysteine nucleosidase [Lachnospiraceae bacterium]
MIGIIGAMDVEIENLRSELAGANMREICGFTFYTGKMQGREVAVVKCGIGKVNAARCAQLLIDSFCPEVIINTGIAGALADDLDVGDVIISERLVQYDVDGTGLGYAKGYLFTGISPDEPTYFRADERVMGALLSSAKKIAADRKVRCGTIATADIFVSSSVLKNRIHDEFGADVAEMEGAAIAQTAQYAGIPFAVLRTASDKADGSADVDMASFGKEASDLAAAIIRDFVSTF